MNQKELYIQYLEDALNHAKTGEPMKKWQTRYIGPNGDAMPKQGWLDVSIYSFFNTKYYELRIKPDPYKWTTFAWKSAHGNITTGTLCGHLREENIGVPPGGVLLYLYHHEIEIE